MRSQMQIYPEVYKTQKRFLEKGAVVRINCIVNMLFHFWYHFFWESHILVLVYVREVIKSC